MPAAVSTLVLAPTPDSARVQLRNALATYFHAQPTAAPAGYSRWAAPATQAVNRPPRLLVGDPVTLMVSPCFFLTHPPIPHLTPHQKKQQENLKILKQYTKLLSQACRERDTLQAAHAQPLSPTPATYPRNLQWFEHLARPYQELDEASSSRITKLLQLHAACDKSVPALPRLQAYELAKSLPHFDRDLTAYYLSLLPNTAREYELHVAHSIMRLHSPANPEDLRRQLATWRHQGLVHVLSVAALNMPDLADWFPVDTPDRGTDEDARSLHHLLEQCKADPGKYESDISLFIAALGDQKSPTAQAIATTLDRLAVLMSVKSNASDEPGHDLASCLQAFPRLDSLEPQDVWTRIKPALELALPPTLLQLDPACAKKRVKHAKGTW